MFVSNLISSITTKFSSNIDDYRDFYLQWALMRLQELQAGDPLPSVPLPGELDEQLVL